MVWAYFLVIDSYCIIKMADYFLICYILQQIVIKTAANWKHRNNLILTPYATWEII